MLNWWLLSNLCPNMTMTLRTRDKRQVCLTCLPHPGFELAILLEMRRDQPVWLHVFWIRIKPCVHCLRCSSCNICNSFYRKERCHLCTETTLYRPSHHMMQPRPFLNQPVLLGGYEAFLKVKVNPRECQKTKGWKAWSHIEHLSTILSNHQIVHNLLVIISC